MAIGAGIGALAGLLVYGAKVVVSKETTWSWRDAGAHAAGGMVGGGAFPLIMTGLAAAGLSTAASYVVAGGLAWGGIWSLAQDAASWALGRADGLAPPGRYVLATAIGLGASALLLPIAARALGPAGQLAPHSGSLRAFLSPSSQNLVGNVAKAEAEFLAYGAISETAGALGEAIGSRSLPALVTRAAGATTHSLPALVTRAAGATTQGVQTPEEGERDPADVDRAVSSDRTTGLAPGASADDTCPAMIPLFGRLGQALPSTETPPPSLGLVDALHPLETSNP